jgi:murein hydrolase activator
MITRREDALAMVRSAMLIGAAFPELRAQAQALSDQLTQIAEVKGKIEQEASKLRVETTRLAEMRTGMVTLVESKKRTESESQRELAELRRVVADHARNVTDLRELIGKLEKEVTQSTRLGAYERQLEADAQQQAALPPRAVEPPPAPARGPAAEPKRQPEVPTVTLAPGGLAMAAPGRIQPAVPFHLAKGRLPQPAAGRRILGFGDRTQRGRSEGVVIETRHGAQITAPNDGWVMYAGEFRSYGHILIINAGGGYHVLLAGLSSSDVQVGQFVLAGEPVGTMPAAARTAQGKAQDNAPVLYVEFRKDQKPIDPEPWWADSARRVQG